MELNIILAVGCTIGVIITTIILYIYNVRKEEVSVRKEYKNIWDIVDGVKQMMVDLVREDISIDATDEEFNRLYKRKAMLSSALKQSAYGMDGAKQVIKDQIMQFIQDNLLPQEVDSILGMDGTSYPSDHIIFETIMQHFKIRYGKNAFVEWMVKYGLQKEKVINGRKRYYISVDELHNSYEEEDINMNESDKQQLLATLVYQLYRGFGILDTVREMNIDGVNIGTSGSVLSSIDGCGDKNTKLSTAEEAVRGCWVYYHGTYIHLRFMNFGSEDEMKRIITMIIRYNNSGSLTAKRGYMVNTMYDKSRVLAVRPPCSEWWACFIRKFSLKNVTVHSLLDKEYVKNGNVVCDLIRYLMLGQTTSLVTGRQGSGKTTLLSAMMAYIDNRFNVRVLELAPELYLRELYPDRNILSVQETNTVSAAELQDCLKKSDAAVSIAGEIATDAVAARFIQFCMTASIFCVGTHHANTTRDLVLTLRNSLVNDGGFNNMETAERQVTECIRCDIHMDYTPDGKRFVHRISEVVPIDKVPYVEFNEEVPDRKDYSSVEEFEVALKAYNMKLEKFKVDLNKDYYQRVTDREGFTVNQIMHYDLASDTYVTDNKPSEALLAKMTSVMEEKDRHEFERFILEYWDAEKIAMEGEIEDIDTDSFGADEEFIGLNSGYGILEEEEDDGAFSSNGSMVAHDESLSGVYDKVKQETEDAEDFSAAMEVMRDRDRDIKSSELADTDEYGEFLGSDSVSEEADEAARKSMVTLYEPVKDEHRKYYITDDELESIGNGIKGVDDVLNGNGDDVEEGSNVTGLWG